MKKEIEDAKKETEKKKKEAEDNKKKADKEETKNKVIIKTHEETKKTHDETKKELVTKKTESSQCSVEVAGLKEKLHEVEKKLAVASANATYNVAAVSTANEQASTAN